MKKVVLGVVALCVAMSSAWANDCSRERREYAECLRYRAEGGQNPCQMSTDTGIQLVRSLEKLKMALEACLIENGRY